jgi:hypothetical protein
MPFRYYPEDWEDLKQAVFDFARGRVTDDAIAVVWSKQDAPSPPPPFVRLDIVTAPVNDGMAEHRNELAIQVTAAIALATYTVTINDVDFTFIADASPTLVEIRDGLIASINAGGEPVTASAIVSDALVLVRDAGAEEPELEVGANLAIKIADTTYIDALTTFSVEVLAPDDVAMTLSKAIEFGLDDPVSQEALHASGWSTSSVEGPRTLDAVFGSRWEKRTGFDMRLRCRQRSVAIIDYVETAGMGTGIVSTFE